jgi:diguanylate cyclase (GGDEF)-like protein/PAS domain S-box-containing protein
MVTTLNNKEDRLNAVKAGANDFLSKPVDKTELEVRMNSLLRMREAQERSKCYQAELESSVKALCEARDELEERVLERTRELQDANENLRLEIAEKRYAKMELQLLEEIFQNSLQGITITDSSGAILRTNPAFESITGYSSEEVVGKNPRILKSSLHEDEFYRDMWRSIENDGRWSGEIWNRRKSGEAYPEWLNIVAIKDSEGNTTHYAGIFHDLTEIKEKEEKIHYHASHDALTDLPNRFLFSETLRKEVEQAKRKEHAVGVMHIDLDNFKRINDCLGHHAGDQVLREIGGRLQRRLRQGDVLGKLSGDDFVILVGEIEHDKHITNVAKRVLGSFKKPLTVNGQELYITASIGISIYPDDGLDAEQLMKNAETATYRAKELGKNGFSFFTAEMNRRIGERLSLEGRLRQALRNDEFEVFLQPRFRSGSMEINCMEALARWREKDGKIISPGDFIPLAEEIGLILPLGEKILRKACARTAELIEQGYGDLTVSVNLSPKQFMQENLVSTVAEVLEETGLPASNLELEITETSVMTDIETAKRKLFDLTELGVSLAVDDFGTGYSSLYYLKHFPINVLKIDRSFIRDIATDPNDAAIVKTIIGLAKNFKLHVVAEGVETEFQLEFLKENGCEEFQGYLLGKPMSVEDFKLFMKCRDEGSCCYLHAGGS